MRTMRPHCLFQLAIAALFFTGLTCCRGQAQTNTTPSKANQDTSPAQPPQVSEFAAMALTSKAFRSAAAKIQPSLVSIESFGGVSAKQGRIGGIRKQGEGNTTGVVVSPDGYILTSTFNFISQGSVVTVTTYDGRKRVAQILGRDDTRKICLLKIDDVSGLSIPKIKPVKDVQVGQWAISLGVGYGDKTPALSMGIISAKNRIGGRAIQTDANISPANYGGPLVDIEGNLIGICVPMNPQSQAVSAGVEWYDSGIGFAVPVEGFQTLIDQLKDGQRILPAFLGVQLVARPDRDGMTVAQVVPESAAFEAGMKPADVLMSINGQLINDMLRLRQVMNQFAAGQKVSLTYFRHDKNDLQKAAQDDPANWKTVDVTLGSTPTQESPVEKLEPPKIR